MSLNAFLSRQIARPVFHQLPSRSLANARQDLSSAYEDLGDQLRSWQGMNYPRRCGKAISMWSLQGAAFPAHNESFSSIVLMLVPLPEALTQYRSIRCPYTRTSVPFWSVLFGACVLVGTKGAPALQRPEQQTHITSAERSAQRQAGSASHIWQLAAEILARTSSLAAECVPHGVLGKCQIELEAKAEALFKQDRRLTAWGCLAGAWVLLYGAELVRVPLELSFLAFELLPVIPLGLIGAVIGLAIFVYSPYEDHWPERRA